MNALRGPSDVLRRRGHLISATIELRAAREAAKAGDAASAWFYMQIAMMSRNMARGINNHDVTLSTPADVGLAR